MKEFIEVTDFLRETKDEGELLGRFDITILANATKEEEKKIIEEIFEKNKINFGQYYVTDRCNYDGKGHCELRIFVRGCNKKLININKIQQIKPFFRVIKSKIVIGCVLELELIGELFVAETYEEIKQKIKEAQGEK